MEYLVLAGGLAWIVYKIVSILAEENDVNNKGN